MTIRRFISVLATAAITLGTAATALAQEQSTTIRIQDYPGTGNLLMKVARAKGFCADRGITCELVVIPSGAGGSQALLAGSIEVGMLPTVGLAAAIAKGAPFVGISGSMVRSVIMFAVSNEKAAGDFTATMKNLEGGKIGVSARGTPGEFVAKMLLKDAGVDPESAAYIAVGGPSTAYLSLSSGQVDAVLSWAPMQAICEVLETCRIAWSQAESPEPKILTLDRGANNLLVVTRAYAEANPQVVEAVRAAAKDAEAWLQDPANFDELVAIVRQDFEIQLERGDEILEQAVRNALPGYKTGFDPEGVKGAAQFAATLKMADRVVGYDEMVLAD